MARPEHGDRRSPRIDPPSNRERLVPRRWMMIAAVVFGIVPATNADGGPGQRFLIHKNGTRAYATPRTTAPVVMRLNRGDRVIEWRRQGGWVKVSRLGTVGEDGWVRISRLRSEARKIDIEASRSGHFFVEANVNGTPIRFLVDTGATAVVLAPDDAEKLGFNEDSLEFGARLRTASGIVPAAPMVLDEIRIGPLRMGKVRAAVNSSAMPFSLLGMSFLGRLRGYEVVGRRLVLRW